MTSEINELKKFLRNYLDLHPNIEAVPSKSANSDKVHLSVYKTRAGTPIGIEFDKETLQNIWLRKAEATGAPSLDVKVTTKNWNGVEWKGEDGKGANHNLKHYDDFPGNDLVRFGVKTKQDALTILDRLVGGNTQNRFLLKVNGEIHCPNGICRPSTSADWEGGEILIPLLGPALARKGVRPNAPDVKEGDELWIWTHEGDKFGRGWGLTAKAIAGPQVENNDSIAVTLRKVERLPRPFGLRNLLPSSAVGDTGSRLLNHINDDRWFDAYLIEDDDYRDFTAVVGKMSDELPHNVRVGHAEGWELEVLNHKDDLLAGLADRNMIARKARPGQAQFRDALMKQYKGRCAVSKCAVPETLEAAHVMPHTGDPKWDHPDNGMMLRRDLHALFDAMLWSIDPKTDRIRLAERLKTSPYRKLDGREIDHQVAPELLEVHFRQFKKSVAND